MTAKTLIVLFMITTLLTVNSLPSFAQTSPTNLQNYVVKLDLAPSHIDEKNSVHSIGYVNLITKTGIPIKAPNDIVVNLGTDDESIASVPSQVIILQGKNHAMFDIKTGNRDGETTITALFQNQIDFENIKVGGIDKSLPDDIKLKINLPSNRMHVNSQMPFSILLVTSDGEVIRTPFDIEIEIDYEDALLKSSVESLVIKKGEYYEWGTLNTHDEIGNAYIRATYDRFGLDTSENIEISSSLPTALKIDVFPSKVGALIEREVELFVSLIDSEGNPSVTPNDVVYKLFSDKPVVSKKIDEITANQKLVIKKGQYGQHVKINKLELSGLLDNEITVGATAEDFGIALGKIFPVAPLSIDHPKAINQTIQVIVPEKVPANTTSILVYQLSAMGNLNREIVKFACDPKTEECGEETIIISVDHPIDLIADDQYYPIQGKENYIAKGIDEKINVISGDNSLIKITNLGKIDPSKSYGVATFSIGEKTGIVNLATTIKGFGAGVNNTEVIDIYRHVETKIFSPTGGNTVVLDKNGFFDLFLVALDEKGRPKVLEKNTKYIVSPVNEIIEIEKNNSFAYANVHSDSFNAGTEETIGVTAVPIGVKAELGLEATTEFDTQVSSLIDVVLPFESLDAESVDSYNGIVRLTDLLGNPSKASKDLRIKLVLDGKNIVSVPEQVTIPEGTSYVTFPITPLGELGDAMISASVKGVIGTETKISTASNLPALKIFSNGIDNPLEPGQPVQLKVYVDDEYAKSVSGASVRFVTNNGASISPGETRTTTDGSAVVDVTADKGPKISIEVFATADGYIEGKQTFDYEVNDSGTDSFALGLPEWVVYVGLAAMIGIVAVIVVFLKKPKPEYDEDEEYEYEEEI